MEKLIDLGLEVGKCKGCGLGANKHTAPLFYEDPKYVMLFESPAFYKDQDDAFLRFVEVFRAKGFAKDDFLFISTVQCSTENSKRQGKQYKVTPPAKLHRQSCRVWLDSYIKAIKPKAIIAFGNIPMEELTGQFDGIKNAHCKVVAPKVAGKITPTILSVAPTTKNLDEIAKVAETLKLLAVDNCGGEC